MVDPDNGIWLQEEMSYEVKKRHGGTWNVYLVSKRSQSEKATYELYDSNLYDSQKAKLVTRKSSGVIGE